MRSATPLLLPFVCWLVMPTAQAQDHDPQPGDDPPSVTLSNETANNTSACSASGTPSYCNEALPNLNTSSGNQSDGAQTTVVDALPEHVSTISAHRLMYKNWSGQVICEYQPWFENTGNYNGHIDIGYNENTLSAVQKQEPFESSSPPFPPEIVASGLLGSSPVSGIVRRIARPVTARKGRFAAYPFIWAVGRWVAWKTNT